MKKNEDLKAELAQLFDIVSVGGNSASAGSAVVRTADDIDQKIFLLIVKYSPEYAALISAFNKRDISEAKFRSTRNLLFHKLAGQYGAALDILKAAVPFDRGYFNSLIVEDPIRGANFKSLQKGEISKSEYFAADKIRNSELLKVYTEKVKGRLEAGEVINDLLT